jgi:hypothetical protein
MSTRTLAALAMVLGIVAVAAGVYAVVISS